MVDQANINTASQRIRMPFSFSGNASEYFGIWIVNLLLSVITFGIYTAWAKVRRLRYFYGNTWLDGHNFEYHAKGSQILIGRIIVVIMLTIAFVLQTLNPLFYFAAILVYLFALPWLINKSIQFNARMTSYRNIRLGFTGTYMKALLVFVLLPFGIFIVAGILSYFLIDWKEATIELGRYEFVPEDKHAVRFGIIFGVAALIQVAIIPYISKLGKEYIGNRLHFGGAKFETDMSVSLLYKNLGLVALTAIIPFVLFGLIIFGVVYSATNLEVVGYAFIVAALIFYMLLIAAPIAYAAGVRNIAFNSTVLDGKHEFMSTLSRRRYVWILFTNFFLILITFGLMRPWAATRTWNYLAENTAMNMLGSMDDFVEVQSKQGNVVATEYMDIEGIDFGL